MRFPFKLLCVLGALITAPGFQGVAWADSINSPNINLNVDTNRSTGAGAGNVAVTVNTITLAEISLPEYSFGVGKSVTLKARPGYQFDPTSNVTAQSATIGINNGAVNAVASVTPNGSANEVLTFTLSSGNGNNANVQDIIRINGIKIKILSAAGAAGPAQTTIAITTSAVGGAFTEQGLVAASINRGAADHLEFAIQPGDNEAAADLLPQVKVVDFGGNLLTTESRNITLSLQANPGSTTLLGTAQRQTSGGVASWVDADNLNMTVAADGYILRATASGTPLLTSSTADSAAFEITAGDPGGLEITTQPVDTTAGGDILLAVRVVDEFGNPNTTGSFNVSLDSAVNPGGWPLLSDTGLTKATVNGVVSWGADDNLRITKAVNDYSLSVSGLGAPLVTNAFDISVGSANSVRFVQQPGNVIEEAVMAPAPTAEIIDAFGNRVNSTSTVTLSLGNPLCNATITGGSAAAVAGLATFSSLSIDSACEDATLVGSASGVVGGASDVFNVKATDAFPIALRSALLRRGQVFQFSSSGTFKISTKAIDDPRVRGAVLTATGTTGRVRYVLAKAGWRKTGTGFTFRNSKCNVTLERKKINALCNGRTGNITLPEPTLDIVLAVGRGTEQYCGQCGGSTRGDETKTFKRVSCAKAAFCP